MLARWVSYGRASGRSPPSPASPSSQILFWAGLLPFPLLGLGPFHSTCKWPALEGLPARGDHRLDGCAELRPVRPVCPLPAVAAWAGENHHHRAMGSRRPQAWASPGDLRALGPTWKQRR